MQTKHNNTAFTIFSCQYSIKQISLLCYPSIFNHVAQKVAKNQGVKKHESALKFPRNKNVKKGLIYKIKHLPVSNFY